MKKGLEEAEKCLEDQNTLDSSQVTELEPDAANVLQHAYRLAVESEKQSNFKVGSTFLL